METKAHPLNRSFEWVPTRGPFRRVSTADARRYDVDGYFVLEEALDAGTVRMLLAEIDPIEAEMEARLRELPGKRFFIARADEITFAPHLVTRSAVLRGFCAGALFRDLAHDLIGPTVRLYWEQSVYKKPETDADFPWHQDNGYTYVEPQQYLTCWLALTDATVDNGCPWVAPGLHRMGTLAHHFVEPLGYECFAEPPEGISAVPAPVSAGGAVFFSSLTPHLTGPNSTSDVRKTYILQYAPTGAQALRGDPAQGGPTSHEPCNHPERQYTVARDGQPVSR